MLKEYFRFNYFYIVIILIWDPIQRFILKVDGAGYSITFLTIFTLLVLTKKKSFYKMAFNNPLAIFGIWLLYSFINVLINGHGYEVPILSFITQITVPFVLMMVICLEFLRNYNRLINVLIIGMYIGVLLVLAFESRSFQGRLHGEINANTIGIMATILTMLLYLKYYYKCISIYIFALLMALPITTVILTGSKTAFGGVTLLLILHFYVNRSKNVVINMARISLAILIFIAPINYILENTILGERILNSTDQTEGMDFETGIPILDKFGDRGYFYYQGWEVFKGNPFLGIGLGNFKNYNSLELAQHSEYMIHLTELGLIGFCLIIFFYYNLFKNLDSLRVYSNNKDIVIYTGYILIILIMITATRMFSEWFMFIIFGLVIGFIIRTKYINHFRRIELLKAQKI